MITRVSSRNQCSSIQHCVVRSCSVLQSHQHLSFERCQVLIHTRTQNLQKGIRWLHCKPIPRCMSTCIEISKTSQACNIINAIVHGSLLICAAQERHFSGSRINWSTTLLAPPARPSFNLLYNVISNRGLSACNSVPNRQCRTLQPTPQLHVCDGVADNSNQPMVNAAYDDLESYESDSYFPPPVMEQDIIIMVCVCTILFVSNYQRYIRSCEGPVHVADHE